MEHKDFIGVYPNAVSDDFCSRAIEYIDVCINAGLACTRQQLNPAEPKFMRDDVGTTPSVASIKHMGPISSEFIHEFTNGVLSHYVSVFDTLTLFDTLGVYCVKGQRTEVGQGYHVWHTESGSASTADRVLAWILYLNDVPSGGETEFLYYPRRIAPTRGTLVVWPAGFTHTHRGNAPLSNTKYVLTGWVEF